MTRALIYPVFLLALTGAASADPGDPPARVARLNYMSGSVSFRPGTVEDWAEATLNYPVTTGDHLWSDENSAAEMHIGSTAIRLGAQTAVEFLNLDDQVAQISLHQGALNIRLRNIEGDQAFEIDTPGGAISLLRAGDYRIDVLPDENTTYVTVRDGEADVNGGGNPFTVRANEQVRIAGDPPAADVAPARAPDGWDQWCMNRDRNEDQAAQVSARYVPREMAGNEDLSANGVWTETPDYGPVWTPRVAPGWAPYHYGHWAWVEPWGWTWIDDAPWGFAPFHYGRWAYYGGAWVWVPGAMVARPVYAPALVVFVGGPHSTLAIGAGAGVAWFPLGPREVYNPGYHVSETYVRRVNVTHVTNVTTIRTVTNVRYVNQTVPGAVVAMPQHAFAGAQPVMRSSVAVTREQITRAEVVTTAPVAPNREAVMGRAGSVRVVRPPARVEARTVVARTKPAPAPVPFTARQQALQANPGRPLDQGTLNNLRSNTPAPLPRVRQVAQTPRPAPMPRVNADRPNVERPNVDRPNVDRPANVRPGIDRPANVSRPNPPAEQPRTLERPATVERPVSSERPAKNERPARIERPTPAERPANVERPAATHQKPERKAESEEHERKKPNRKKEGDKKEQ